MQALYHLDRHAIVLERLTHAHEDHVGKPARRGLAGGEHDLLQYFAGAQVPGESGLTGGAKRTTHPAAGLAGDADRHPVVIGHQNGFDGRPVVQSKDPLTGRAPVALDVIVDLQTRWELPNEAGAQGLGDGGYGVKGLRLAPQPVPDLVDAVAGLVGE